MKSKTKIIISIILILFIILNILNIMKNNEDLEELNEQIEEFLKLNEKRNLEIDESIEKNLEYYGGNEKYELPYLPEGFQYICGEWNNGFVIQDKNENEFVWVPCVLYDKQDVVKLQRSDFEFGEAIIPQEYERFKNELNESFKNCLENDVYIEKFIQSVAKNGGFYIGRYEAGIDNDNIVIKKDVKPLVNRSFDDVEDAVQKLYNNINCSIINGFAWDSTIKWIEMNNGGFSVNTYDRGNKSTDIKNTGIYSVNNIYDLNGNVYESTTEIMENKFRVLRGSKIFNYEAGSRTVVLKDEKQDFIGYRFILYD